MKRAFACTAALAALGFAAGTTSLSATEALTVEMLAQSPGDIAVVQTAAAPSAADRLSLGANWVMFAQSPGDIGPFAGIEPAQSASATDAGWTMWAEAPGDIYAFMPIQLAQGPGDINVDWTQDGYAAFAQILGEQAQTY